MTTSLRYKGPAVAGGLVLLAGFLLLDGVPKTGGGRNAPAASNLSTVGKDSAGRPYKFSGKYGPNARWSFAMGQMYFEPASEEGGAFISRGRGASLRLDGNEVLFALRSQKSGARSQKNSRQWPVVSGQWQRTTDNGLLTALGDSLFTIHHSLFVSPFSGQNSELSPAPSTQPLAPSFVRLSLVGANPNAKVIGLDKLKGRSNYFIGNDPKKWRTNVPNYARVLVKDVYPGIDQVFYGKESTVGGRESGLGSRESGEMEFDFVLHPGADPKVIRLAAQTDNWKMEDGNWKIENRQSKIENASDGDLVLQTDAGEVRLGKPLVYQAATEHEQRTTDPLNRQSTIENRQFLQGQYALTANNELRFEVGAYDPRETLVIDPTLNYLATFGGSNGDTDGFAIAVDVSGNAYIAGLTTTSEYQSTPGAFQTTCNPAAGPCADVFVRKIDPTGAVVYSTYLGGSGIDQALGVATDSSGDTFVTGLTESTDFPVLNAFQPTLAGGGDAFVAELDPTGSALVYSSYLGGAANSTINTQQGNAIAVDTAGNAYVTGKTSSSDFPTLNAFQPVLNGGTSAECGGTVPRPCADTFITKVAAGGSALVYSTFLGGSDDDGPASVAVDSAGDAYVAGHTTSIDLPTSNAFQAACSTFVNASGQTVCDSGFVTELDPGGSALAFSTYLGGSNSSEATGVALDSLGNIYIAGGTSAADFPTLNALQACGALNLAFVAEFKPGASQLVYSTCYGNGGDVPWSIGVDALGEAYIAGWTDDSTFPLVNAVQPTYGGGSTDAFVVGFQAGGAGVIYSTYLGANGTYTALGVAVDGAGDVYVTGGANTTGATATFAGAISRPEVLHRYVSPRPSTSTSVTQGVGASIGLDMARVHAAPASLDFGAEVAGTTSAPQPVTISNPGTAPLTFSGIAASDNFTVPSGGSCSTSSPVAPGGNCTVDVAFAPTVGGNLTGTLTLTDNGIGSPHSVLLSGTGQDFTLTTNQSSASVTAGGSATFNLSVASQGGFNHSLDLSCTDPASLSTCTVSPASVTPTSASPATVAVSITTTAPSQVGPRGTKGPRPFAGHRPALQLWMFALALLALLAVAAMSSSPRVAVLLRRRRPRESGDPWIPAFAGMTGKRVVVVGCLALALLLVLAWAACGGGGQPGTPAGTYTVTLKALDTQANLSHSTTVTLTVHGEP